MTSPTDAVPEASEGLTLLGAEMLSWSDYTSSVPAAEGGALRGLVRDAAGDAKRVLFVGPHDGRLVAEVARSCEQTDVFLRSLPDAERLREEVGAAVGISAGAFASMSGTGYDLVLALDGLGRLMSAEEAPLSWHDQLDRLLGFTAEGGRALVAMGNEAGLDRLLTVPPAEHDDDAHWPSGRLAEEEAPLGFAELSAALASRDGWSFGAWACFGRRTSPVLAAPSAVFDRLRHDGRLGALIERAAWRTTADTLPVRDPARLARTLLRHGQSVEVAPIWLFDGRRGAATALADELLLRDDVTGDLASIDVATEPWHRTLLEAPAPGRAGAGVERDPGRLTGPLPAGVLVFDRMLEAVAAQDLAVAGALVRRYRDWLASDATVDEEAGSSGVALVSVAKTAMTFGDLLDTGAELVPFDPRLIALAPAPLDDVLARTVLVFARDLHATRRRHAWPAAFSVKEIAAALAAAAGVRIVPEEWPRIEELDRLLSTERDTGGLAQLSYAEALAENERFRAALDASEEQLEWLVIEIHKRQRTAVRVNAANRRLLESPQYRIGQRVLWVREGAKRIKANRAARKATPAGEWRPPVEGAEREPIPVEPELLPPGYEAKGPML